MAAVPSIGRASLVESPGVAPQAAATQGLYERHAAKIQSYCHHQLGSREEAEDAVQTTFMNAFRALGRGVVPEAELAWLFKIAENVCLSRRRSSWRRGRIESANDFEVIEEIVPGPSRQHDELIGIEDALASMPEQQRRAILLREWQGLSYREVAEELEISQSAVETLIFRARRSLAQGLEQPDSIKPKRKSFRRAMHALDISGAIGALKTLLVGSAAVKATAAAVAVTAAAGTAATVTPKIEGMLPHAPKAKPALVAPSAGPSSFASTSDSPAAGVDPTAPRSVVPTSAADSAKAATRAEEQAIHGKVGAVKHRKRTAPVGSNGQRAAPPLGALPEAPVAETPASSPVDAVPVPVPVPVPAPAAEPKQPEQARRDEPKGTPKREEPKRDEPKREGSKGAEPKQDEPKQAAQTRTDEGKKAEGKKDESKKDESKKGGSKKEDATVVTQARAPQAVVSLPGQSAAPPVQETKQVEGNGGDKSEKREKGEREKSESERGEREKSERKDAPPSAPVAGVPAVVTEQSAAAPAPAPAPESRDRDRGDRGNSDDGKRKRK